MCLAEFMGKDTPGREAAPAKRGRGHPTQNRRSRWCLWLCPGNKRRRVGEKLGSQWEPPRTVHHGQEFRFPPARSKEPPKDLKQDVIRSCLQIPLETAENGLERVGLEAQEQVGSLCNCPLKKQ